MRYGWLFVGATVMMVIGCGDFCGNHFFVGSKQDVCEFAVGASQYWCLQDNRVSRGSKFCSADIERLTRRSTSLAYDFVVNSNDAGLVPIVFRIWERNDRALNENSIDKELKGNRYVPFQMDIVTISRVHDGIGTNFLLYVERDGMGDFVVRSWNMSRVLQDKYCKSESVMATDNEVVVNKWKKRFDNGALCANDDIGLVSILKKLREGAGRGLFWATGDCVFSEGRKILTPSKYSELILELQQSNGGVRFKEIAHTSHGYVLIPDL